MSVLAAFSLFITFFFQTPAPAGFDLPLVALLSGFIATPTKIVVDIIRGMFERLPSRFVPALGVVVAYAMCMVALVAIGAVFGKSVYAQCFLASLGAQGLAMVASGLQNKVNKTEERVDAALAAPAGTTKAEVDAQVFKGTGNGK